MGLFSKKVKPFIIGVCGRSCSGKSTVVETLEKENKDFLHIKQDKFFKKHIDNWESPHALRNDRLVYSIKKLKNGESTHIPAHTCTEVFDRLVKPHKVIIVEGYLLFENKELADLFDLKIFVDVSDENLLKRRIERQGIHKEDYIKNVVIPESRKYEEIQKERADYIVDGNVSKEEIKEKVEEIIRDETYDVLN
jgi:uridine kinase